MKCRLCHGRGTVHGTLTCYRCEGKKYDPEPDQGWVIPVLLAVSGLVILAYFIYWGPQ